MIRFLGHVVALPLQLLLVIVSIIPIVDRMPLIRALWYLTRKPIYACNLILLAAQRNGIDAARQIAEQAFSIRPDASIIATIGQTELQAGFLLDNAYRWYQKARHASNLQNPDNVLPFMLLLSDHIPDISALALVDEILSRKDLPMNLTRMAMTVRAELYLRERRWSEAEQVASRILSIEDNPTARWVEWVAAAGRKDTNLAGLRFNLIPKAQLGYQYPLLSASGYLYLNDMPQCHAFLRQAIEAGVPESLIRLHNPVLAGQIPFLSNPSVEENR